jgi:hypothetical protein
MKKAVTLILLSAFATQTFSQAIILIDFYLNQSYIAASKCENRLRPMLHCNGHCVLAKKIKQEEQKDRENPERKLENKNEVLSSKSFFISVPSLSSCTLSVYALFSDKSTIGHSLAVFHPPCA